MNNHSVSIAIATYNGGLFLSEQLSSILMQTRLPDEVVISDDCSTDDTLEIIKNFQNIAKFKVIYYINKCNVGYTMNFNSALIKTTGDIVLLSDQDDVWFPEKIATILDIINSNPEKLLIMNDASITDGNLNETGLTKHGQCRAIGLSERDYVLGCCYSIKRELLDICMPIDRDYRGHDDWIGNFADGLEEKLVINNVLQYYRRHGQNVSPAISNKTTKITKIERNFRGLKKLLKGRGVESLKLEISRNNIFLHAIKRAKSNNNSNYLKKLSVMEVEYSRIFRILENRKSLQRKPMPTRIFSIFINILTGGYRHRSRMRWIAEDIFI